MARDAVAPWAEPVLLSAADLIRLPDDGWRYELVQGRLVRMAPSGFEHGITASNVLVALRHFVDGHGLGRVTAAETGFLLSRPGKADTVLSPDVAFIATERVPAPGTAAWDGFPRLAPDLGVEIASPGQHRLEMAAKAGMWLRAGVRLMWVLWPATRTVDLWRAGTEAPAEALGAADQLDGEDVLPGFSIPVAQLFR